MVKYSTDPNLYGLYASKLYVSEKNLQIVTDNF